MQSLGQCFLQNGRIVEQENINQRWLHQVHEIIERMRLLLGDYSRVASDEDEEYQTYSPFLNASMYDTKAIEFDLNEQLVEAKHHSMSTRALRWLGIKASNKVNDNLDSWKWALVEKRKFEKVIVGLQEENKRLKDILPLMAALPALEVPPNRTEDSQRLGLLAHRQLKQIVHNEENTAEITFLNEHLRPLPTSPEGPLVHCGALLEGQATQNVLVEYKSYLERDEQTDEEIQIDSMRAHQLAKLLASAGDNNLATLQFRGLLEEPTLQRHTFAFNFPTDPDTLCPPVSLHNLIEANKADTRLDLPRRFQVAAKIAR